MLHERVEARLLDGNLRLASRVVVASLLDLLIQHFEKVLLTGGDVPASGRQGEGRNEMKADNRGRTNTYWLCKIGPFFFRIGIITSLLFGSGELPSDNCCSSSSIFSFSF